ncbi:Glyoxylate succinic semialdehyde reductase 2, chloroplastic [Lecanosticta acicola]|uniref:Glyoxylate succinic semialdehyde reductase 2, chloroplastic n=1 Tax=Lecanosticta acicola TaxID=111012 RepID=A0AAI8Z9B4_9PEZI|nr:Glyoxylate succinic semialdehyde reductase 2, chloroplastic [Lecanosticta acicola]
MAVTPPVVTISSSSNPPEKSPAKSHRLPTQSAAEALSSLEEAGSAAVASGLGSLDRSLAAVDAPGDHAGFQRGKVAEIWGPSGSGKTALAVQTATQAIKRDECVTWIDCATALCASRLEGWSDARRSKNGSPTDDLISPRFRHFRVSTLSHVLALILHPPDFLLSDKPSALVIDDLHTLIDLDYPRMPYTNNSTKTEQQKWLAGRRYAILGSLVTALNKLAALHNMAVLVTTGCSSRMRSDSGLSAAVGPGIGGSEWEAGIWSRIVTFRDFSGRCIGVQKAQGRNITPLDPVGDVRNAIAFEITADGSLREHIVDLTSSNPTSSIAAPPPPPIAKKSSSPVVVKVVRKRTYDEIADSDEDEDLDEYGWAEKDDEFLAAEGRTTADDELKPSGPDEQAPPTT